MVADMKKRQPTTGKQRILHEMVEIRRESIDSPVDSVRDYDELHTEGRLVQRDSFYWWLLGLLSPRPGQLLLDVSCGQGALVRFATEVGLLSAGLDLSDAAVAEAAQQSPSALVSLADAERLPFGDNTFDHVTNIGSVEHYFDPPRAVGEMARVLRPDGLGLVLLPNTFGLLGNIIHVMRTGDVFDDGQPLQRYGTNAQWQRLLEQNGLRVARVVKYERARPRTWGDLKWYLRRPWRFGRVLAAPLIPRNLTSFLVYLCEKVNS
jgi:ubiquinone/menaquinone biosynthesis C-methylase UbiE